MTHARFILPTRQSALRFLRLIAHHKLAFAAFLVPLSIRIIPEILSGPYPVGWDVIAYYIPNTIDMFSGNMNLWGIITSPPVMYAIVAPAYLLARADLVLIFKVLGPILYGLLGWSIFWFCQRRLRWSSKKALYAVLFISAYFVTLRISWDAYEAELGLALLLLAESIQTASLAKPIIARVSLLSVAVLSNQLVGVLIVGTQLATLLSPKARRKASILGLQFVPIALFSFILYATMQTSQGPGLSVTGPIASASVLTTNIAFLVYAYVFLVPLILLGFRLPQKSVFTPWMTMCGVGLLISMLPGHIFQDIGYRWVLLLSLPLSILAYDGYSRLRVSGAFITRNWSGALRVLVLVLLCGSAILYAVLPAQSALPFFTLFPQNIPSSLVQSSLPSSDYPNVVNAMLWVDSHIGSDGVLVTHEAFYGWARIYLSPTKQVLNSLLSSPTSVIDQISSYTHVFTVWWIDGSGWFQGSFPSGARTLVTFGDLAVYELR